MERGKRGKLRKRNINDSNIKDQKVFERGGPEPTHELREKGPNPRFTSSSLHSPAIIGPADQAEGADQGGLDLKKKFPKRFGKHQTSSTSNLLFKHGFSRI